MDMTKTTPIEIKDKKKVAAIYCRVSTEEQSSKDENSLNVQESTLRKYCLDQG